MATRLHRSGIIRYGRQIGFVSQDAQLFAGTIKENLLFVQPDATDEQMMDALHKAACDRSGEQFSSWD